MTTLGDRTRTFRDRLAAGEPLSGRFIKAPHHRSIELAAIDGVDCVAIDTEHAPIGVAQLDAMLAVARALDLPAVVRVPDDRQPHIQQALDLGAVGVIVPHVTSAAMAADVSRRCRYGPGGRGYAGTTRAGGWGSIPMHDVIDDASATVVVVQIEDVDGVGAADEICRTTGINGVFVGAADLRVAMGGLDADMGAVEASIDAVIDAAKRFGSAAAAYAGDVAEADAWRQRGASLVFAGSDDDRLAR